MGFGGFTEAHFFVVGKCFWTVGEVGAYGGNIIVGFVTDSTLGDVTPPRPPVMCSG